MPPKRRDREGEGSKNGKIDHMQDHELFLQAFEKPTQMYRYLSTRNQISPVFLYRTLTYMKQKMTRSHKGRTTFQINEMLNSKLNKAENDSSYCLNGLGENITLMFLGFFDKTMTDLDEKLTVSVETSLLKISCSKKRDTSSDMKPVVIGTSEVIYNPCDITPVSKISAISIPTETFKNAGLLNKSYIILFKIQLIPLVNNNNLTNNGSIEEPSIKRFKSSTKLYGSELVVFDKHSRCILTEGEYELALQEIPQCNRLNSPKKISVWETIPEAALEAISDKTDNPFNMFSKSPTLKFRLVWTKENNTGFVDRPLPLIVKPDNSLVSNKENRPQTNHNNNNISNSNGTVSVRKGVPNTTNKDVTLSNSMVIEQHTQLVYHFMYNNNTRQQTETCYYFFCPWCRINCLALYSLLKHLKLCHARFVFTYVPSPETTILRIDVAINDLYDGSYAGSPHDLAAPSGFTLKRGPVRRTTVTHILVCRPRRQKPNLNEFLEVDENELNSQRPYITGHNRLYHHTMTCLPVHPKELDVDSEGESDPLWLQQKTMMMIDEFSDVNEGEKELMKMWNLHVMKFGYVGDCQIPLACDMFLDTKGRELLQKNLYRNFVLHLSSLFDYGLISPEVLYKAVQKLQRILGEYVEGNKIVNQARTEQVEYWNKFGVFKHQLALEEQQQEQLLQEQLSTAVITSTPFQLDNNIKVEEKCEKSEKKERLKELFLQNDEKPSTSVTATTPTSITPTTNTIIKSTINCKNTTMLRRSSNKQIIIQNQAQKNKMPKLLTGNLSNGNGATKRKLTQLKESPPRRRSAGQSPQQLSSGQISSSIVTTTTSSSSLIVSQHINERVKFLPTRRRSVAAIGGTGGGLSGLNNGQRKRMSFNLTKVEK